MKKIFIVILIIVTALALASCNLGFVGGFTFTGVHICDFSGNCTHATIEKWYESDNGIEIKTTEYGSLFLSEGTYILFNDTCPICGAEGEGND